MKLNALRKVGALTVVSAVTFGYAVAGPNTAPGADPEPTEPPAPSGDPALPPPPSGTLWGHFSGEVGVGYDSDYVFRGYKLGHDHAWSQVDLMAPLGKAVGGADTSLFLGAWYTTAYNDGENELDLYASLDCQFETWGLGVGYIHYTYPNGLLGDGSSNGGETNEVWVSVGTTLDLTSSGESPGVSVGLKYYYDFDLEISYLEASAGTSFELNESVRLNPEVGISYINNDNAPPDVEDSGFNHFFASLKLPIALTDYASLTPYVSASSPLDVADDFGEDDYFWGGIALKVSF